MSSPLIFNPLHAGERDHEQDWKHRSLWLFFVAAHNITLKPPLPGSPFNNKQGCFFTRAAAFTLPVNILAEASVAMGGWRGGSTYRAPIGRAAETRGCSAALCMKFIVSFGLKQ